MLNKQAAAEYLGVSTRTVELYMKHETRPLVPDDHVKGRGGSQPMFEQKTLDDYKALMEREAERAVVKRETAKPEGAKSQALASRFAPEDLARVLSAAMRPPSRLVTRKAAAEESGLSVSAIAKAIKAGRLREVKGIGARGASVLRLSDVLAYASSLFDEQEGAA